MNLRQGNKMMDEYYCELFQPILDKMYVLDKKDKEYIRKITQCGESSVFIEWLIF